MNKVQVRLSQATLADRAIEIAVVMVASSDEGPTLLTIEDASNLAVQRVNEQAIDLKTPTAIDDVTKFVGEAFGRYFWD